MCLIDARCGCSLAHAEFLANPPENAYNEYQGRVLQGDCQIPAGHRAPCKQEERI
jgi:hypothetical protein